MLKLGHLALFKIKLSDFFESLIIRNHFTELLPEISEKILNLRFKTFYFHELMNNSISESTD